MNSFILKIFCLIFMANPNSNLDARTNFTKFVLGPYRLTVRTSPSRG